MGTLRAKVATLPRRPGVYLWKSSDGEVLYVGKAVDLRARTGNYVTGTQDGKTARLMELARDLDFIVVRNEKEALVLEQTLIKRHRPRYNVRLTDGKGYPYLKLTREKYPRLLKVFRRTDDGATYFGPFPDGYGAFHVLQTLNDLLPLRRCRVLPKQKCLYYDIGKCIAPCIDACTDEEYDDLVAEARRILRGDARHLVRRVQASMEEAAAEHRYEDAARLRDQLRGLEGVLERQHMTAQTLQERDIAALSTQGDAGVVVLLHQREGKIVGQSAFSISGASLDDPGVALAEFLRGHYADRAVPRNVTAELPADVAADLEADLRLLRDGAVTVETPQRGEKKRWLDVATTNARLRAETERLQKQKRGMGAVEALQGALGLDDPPRIIEGFDISHHAGHHTRAAMVRFVDGVPDKGGYRTFAMRTVGEDAIAAGHAERAHGQGREVDDYASMHEAVLRRYRRLVDEDAELPDLVLIDGGPGQLEAARKALHEAGVTVAVCALAKREEEIHVPGRMRPITLDKGHSGLQLLQRVRDESHRFGISQVRKKATASATASPLDAVPGIGPKKRAALISAFAGLEGLRQASVEDMLQVPGISRPVAEAVAASLQATDAGPEA